MNNKKIYRSEEFAFAWNKYLEQKPDSLRTNLMNKFLIKKSNIDKNSIVLDAGCGNGFFIKEILDKNPKKVFACDISPKLISIAKAKFPNKVEFSIVDLTKKLKYESNFFSEIICYNVLMELDNIYVTLKEFRRILKDNGIIHIVVVHPLFQLSVINNDKEKKMLSLLKKYSQPYKLKVNILKEFNDFYVYSRPISYYFKTFKKAGLKVEELEEIFIPDSISRKINKYELKNVPVFLYFNLTKNSSK